MTIQATAQWWIRTDGDDDNGGGFDSGISGAGTNYSDQATAQLDLTDLATASAGSTTLTSATGGFTAAMIGNCVKIRSGTNVTNGYYFITAYTDTNTVTIDRACDDGVGGLSGGSGKVGGAWTNIERTLSNNAVSLGNTVASPLIGGHQVNVRGSGSDNPSTPDYTNFTSWRWFPSGTVEKRIKFVGYNGKPSIQAASSSGSLIMYELSNYIFEDMKFVANGTGNNVHGLVTGTNVFVHRCIFDMAGHNAKAGQGSAYNCYFYDSGSVSNITYSIWHADNFNAIIAYNFFDNLPVNSSQGIIRSTAMATVLGNLVLIPSGAKGCSVDHGSSYKTNFIGNIFVGGDIAMDIYRNVGGIISGNIFSGCTTGIKWSPSGATEKPPAEMITGNAFYNCTNNYNNISGTGDIILSSSPFVDAAGGDFNLNATNGGGAVLRSTSINLGS